MNRTFAFHPEFLARQTPSSPNSHLAGVTNTEFAARIAAVFNPGEVGERGAATQRGSRQGAFVVHLSKDALEGVMTCVGAGGQKVAATSATVVVYHRSVLRPDEVADDPAEYWLMSLRAQDYPQATRRAHSWGYSSAAM